jgi:hypothetical protein
MFQLAAAIIRHRDNFGATIIAIIGHRDEFEFFERAQVLAD